MFRAFVQFPARLLPDLYEPLCACVCMCWKSPQWPNHTHTHSFRRRGPLTQYIYYAYITHNPTMYTNSFLFAVNFIWYILVFFLIFRARTRSHGCKHKFDHDILPLVDFCPCFFLFHAFVLLPFYLHNFPCCFFFGFRTDTPGTWNRVDDAINSHVVAFTMMCARFQ